MIFVDQDDDGSRIMALLINLFHVFPSLLQALPDYLCRFATPIIRVFDRQIEHSFFSIPEYEAWVVGKSPGKVKYYKGLGKSSNADAALLCRNVAALRSTSVHVRVPHRHRQVYGAQQGRRAQGDAEERRLYASTLTIERRM